MIEKFSWSGDNEPFLDNPVVKAIGRVALGRYGGHGGKNEDGALVWCDRDWVFAAILDGHAGSESVEAVLDLLTGSEAILLPLCRTGEVATLQRELVRLLTDSATSSRMARLKGETACLISYQWRQHLLWLSIGDNTLYLLHPELARLGQFTLTVRNFYEWLGERNSLAGPLPYFTTGIRQLRQGRNTVVLVTDGIQELPTTPFEPPSAFSAAFHSRPEPAAALGHMLAQAQHLEARDSCTMIAWNVDNPEPALMPSG